MSIKSDLETLRPFIGRQQMRCLTRLLRCEERAAFVEIVTRLAETVRTMPKTYEQDGLGDKAIVHLHYFVRGCDWWITEKDVETPEEPGQHQAFGLASINGREQEIGYISIVEILASGVELDFYWWPRHIDGIRRGQG